MKAIARLADSALGKSILALGVTQIIGYGTLYYAFAILVPGIATDLGLDQTYLFTLMSAGLLLGGFLAPFAGRMMDRFGAPALMAPGSLISAVLLVVLAGAQNTVTFSLALLAIELVSPTVLYGAAFATLTQIDPASARRAITALTLFGGFASTLFWPLTGALLTLMDWRGVYTAYAGLHVLVALPLHLWVLTLRRRHTAANRAVPAAAIPAFPPLPRERQRAGFWLFASSVALSGFLMAGINFHFVPILTAAGLGSAAYIVSMFMGPAQVLARLTEAVFWQNLHPLTVAIVSALTLPVSIGILMLDGPAWLCGAAFAIGFGSGQGLSSIIMGTVPLALFGAGGYAQRFGQISLVRTLLSACAPAGFAITTASLGMTTALWAAAGIGALAAIPLILLTRQLRAAPATA